MSINFIGRKSEIELLLRTWSSGDPELVCIYGRRRVGKTELIRHMGPKSSLFLEFTGQKNALQKTQLENFAGVLAEKTGFNLERPKNWPAAFKILNALVNKQIKEHPNKPVVLFFDEAPWLDSRKSGFLTALEYFWNNMMSKIPEVKVVICGSAAAWVIDKIINGRGGWHNRVTQKIRVEPFNLSETRSFLHDRGIPYSNRDVTQAANIFGGIPLYLKMIKKGEALEVAIERLFFTKSAPLATEFEELFYSLFDSAQQYQDVVRFLTRKQSGFSRQDIAQHGIVADGGGLTKLLANLRDSCFITEYRPLNESNTYYRITDSFCLFFLKWLDGPKKATSWQSVAQSPSYSSWLGFAFEIIAWNHEKQIVAGLYLTQATWRATKADLKEGGEVAKIDLLIDIDKGSVFLIEMKFHGAKYEITSTEIENIKRRQRVLGIFYKGKRSIIPVLLAPQGVKSTPLWQKSNLTALPEDTLFNS